MATNMDVLRGGVFISEVWADEIQHARDKNLIFANLVKRFDADVKQRGDVVHVPKLSNYTAIDKTANGYKG